jgi:cell wall-associated NlpC family hydrolase
MHAARCAVGFDPVGFGSHRPALCQPVASLSVSCNKIEKRKMNCPVSRCGVFLILPALPFPQCMFCQMADSKKAAAADAVATASSDVPSPATPAPKSPATTTAVVPRPFGSASAAHKPWIALALKLVGSPGMMYKDPTSGRSPKDGFDCSGFVTYCLKHSGVPVGKVAETGSLIRHSTDLLASFGLWVHDDMRAAGDLLFFSKNGRTTCHVGFYIGNNRMIHSPGKDGTVVDVVDLNDYVGGELVATPHALTAAAAANANANTNASAAATARPDEESGKSASDGTAAGAADSAGVRYPFPKRFLRPAGSSMDLCFARNPIAYKRVPHAMEMAAAASARAKASVAAATGPKAKRGPTDD